MHGNKERYINGIRKLHRNLIISTKGLTATLYLLYVKNIKKPLKLSVIYNIVFKCSKDNKVAPNYQNI